MTTSQNGGEIAVAISPMKGSKALHHAAHVRHAWVAVTFVFFWFVSNNCFSC
jgi:hypothetical protein